MVIKTPLSALVLGLALTPAVFSLAAKADPHVLTAPELAAVTAGQVVLPPIQLNVNVVTQVAKATSIAIAVCGACKNPTVTAVAPSTAFNINFSELSNLNF